MFISFVRKYIQPYNNCKLNFERFHFEMVFKLEFRYKMKRDLEKYNGYLVILKITHYIYTQ